MLILQGVGDGDGVQNLGKPADVILERSLGSGCFEVEVDTWGCGNCDCQGCRTNKYQLRYWWDSGERESSSW